MLPKTRLVTVQSLNEGDVLQAGYRVDDVVLKDGGRVQVHMNDWTSSTTYEYGEMVKVLVE